METLVEENGNPGASDPLGNEEVGTVTSVGDQDSYSQDSTTYKTYLQVQSVIQPNQQSVIQTATNIQPVQLSKGNVILVGKPNSVIQTASGNLQTLQVVETGSDDSLSADDEGSTKKRRDILSRRPSYRKILNDLGGGEIAVIPAGAIQISSGQGDGMHTLTMTNATSAGGAIVQYAQGQEGQQFFVPVVAQNSSGSMQSAQQMAEEAARKRELRLLKNREAARECRRKKKEYIKCLENRVAVLENQNKALIDELKSLKELYCQQKVE
ncbi:cyclic AMP-responsive element-binding protein 1 isoform X2 [Neocloeon triangulifer]|uniref:cyclic AMP-responsive element-binding protein 1 isoform X2 n=1 Tax=Neocloeon triangulifer TaxID=2078957 RepID=UPI00286F3C9E|nr:cyclic AMP-responsive element-binding protein 1 isoform X2 [Neocloeon triangulifer]